MILRSLHITGFGRLVDRHFTFAPGLNVVYGPNESGKSTLANAIVATLYGAERKKDLWRPWNVTAFATTLTYELNNGDEIEVQREFDRDAKGVRVYDRDGRDLSASMPGSKLIPGEAHLGIPLDVFLNAACVKQQAIAIDTGKDAAPIATHLARALDGGPREDAALGAISRLDEALRLHVGTERARKNAPLRNRRAQADLQSTKIADARARLEALDDLRERIERVAHERERLTASAAEMERRLRSLRAGSIGKQLANLHAFRAELAELQADHAGYDDVAGFPSERESELEEAFAAWTASVRAAAAAQTEAETAKLTDADKIDLERRRRDVGSIDDATFDALAAANARAGAARTKASVAGREAAAARVDDENKQLRNAILAAGVFALCVAVGFAIAHSWVWTGIATAIAAAGLVTAYAQGRERAQQQRNAAEKQQIADDALEAEHAAKNAVSSVLDPVGMQSFEELLARRSRLTDLLARKRNADSCVDRARMARLAAEQAASRFDALADAVVPDVSGDRAARKAAANARAARKRERDGLDAHLHALEMRKSTILGSDAEYVLEAERAELQRDGVEPSDEAFPGERRTLESERNAIAEQLRVARETHSRLAGERTGAAQQIPDLAALDEELARTRGEIARLEAFERAVTLAKTTLEARTHEAHAAFARRLEDYAAGTLGAITAGRYGEIFVDPVTLRIKVRVPETQAITELDSVSAGTRDQTYLVVRFAMARMFAEGIETPPLLLDDPFAYWDTTRIERCLPIMQYGARDTQAVLFTASRELADAAQRGGAHRIDLPAPSVISASTAGHAPAAPAANSALAGSAASASTTKPDANSPPIALAPAVA